MMFRQLLFVLTAGRAAVARFEREQHSVDERWIGFGLSGESKQMLDIINIREGL
jgi:hypothetical protein